MTKLTPATARDMKPGDILRDHVVTGLQLRCFVTGTKTWALWYRTREGKERRPRIGGYPEFTLERARSVAAELKERVARGEDPSGDWQGSRAAPTVSDLCDRYLAEWAASRMAANSIRQHRQLIEAYIRPGLGSKRLTEVTSVDVDRFLDKVYNQHFVGGTGTAHWPAHHTRNLLAKLFRRVNKFYSLPLPQNPMEDTKTFGRIKRKRHAKENEIPTLAGELEKLALKHPRYAAYFWTLFLTGGRVTEIHTLTGEQITVTDTRWIATLKKHKTSGYIGDKEIVIPAQAVEILSKLPKLKPTKRIFGDITISRFEVIWRKLRNRAGCTDLKLLDARRTFASFGLSNGLSLEQVGELLGHTDAETTKGYAYLIEEARHKSAASIADAFVLASKGPSTDAVKNDRESVKEG